MNPAMRTNHRGGSATELFHHIKASVRELLSSSVTSRGNIEERLATLLRQALAVGSPYDVAVVLACGAELQMFPGEDVMERCTATVHASGQPDLRGIVWAVRHRCARSRGKPRRFSIELIDEVRPAPFVSPASLTKN